MYHWIFIPTCIPKTLHHAHDLVRTFFFWFMKKWILWNILGVGGCNICIFLREKENLENSASHPALWIFSQPVLWRPWFVLWTITTATDYMRCPKRSLRRSKPQYVAVDVLVRRKKGENAAYAGVKREPYTLNHLSSCLEQRMENCEDITWKTDISSKPPELPFVAQHHYSAWSLLWF